MKTNYEKRYLSIKPKKFYILVLIKIQTKNYPIYIFLRTQNIIIRQKLKN